MVDLKGFEFYAITGDPVVGADVSARLADDTHPNPNAVAGTASTDANGMWEITGLAEGAYDIEVEISSKTWRHKGNSKLSLAGLYLSGANYVPVNWLRNGGVENWPLGVGGFTLSTTPDTTALPPFSITVGTGSTGTLSKETSVVPSGSATSAKVVYSHSSGEFRASMSLTGAVLSGLRGKTMAFQAHVQQGAASMCAVRIYDGATTTTGSRSATTGSFVALDVSAAIPTSATTIRVDVIADVTGTFYFDKMTFAIGTTISQFIPHPLDTDGGTTYLDALVVNGPAQIGSTLTLSGALAMSSATASDNLTFSADTKGVIFSAGGKISDNTSYDGAGADATVIQAAGDVLAVENEAGSAFLLRVTASSMLFGAGAGSTVWHAGNDGAGSGLDADLFDGLNSSVMCRLDASSTHSAVQIQANATAYQVKETGGTARDGLVMDASNRVVVGATANALRLLGSSLTFNDGSDRTVWHSGNDGTGSTLDADLLDGNEAAAFLKLVGGTMTGNITFNDIQEGIVLAGGGFLKDYANYDGGGNPATVIAANGDTFVVGNEAFNAFILRVTASSMTLGASSTVWHSGNDGAGSGLDADTVDGVQAASFARSDAATNFTTAPTINSDAVAVIIKGTYAGNNGSSRQITTGFACDLVIIQANTGGAQAFAHLTSTTAGLNVWQTEGTSAVFGVTALHASDGFVVDHGTDVSTFNTSGITYSYTAIGHN